MYSKGYIQNMPLSSLLLRHVALPMEMGKLSSLNKLVLEGNENLSLNSSGLWRLTGLQELALENLSLETG
jgi:hypothetical protein